MDKGIRPACNSKFLELLPTRVNTREGNVAFRKSVIGFVMEEFDATLPSAATHYNHAFINARKLAVDPEQPAEYRAKLTTLLAGLGRPEDKKGGRKPKAKTQPAATVPSVIPTPVNALLQNLINVGAVKPAAVITAAAAQVGLEDLQQPDSDDAGEETPADEAPQGGDEQPADAAPAVTLYTVFKSVKGTEVAKDLTEDQADELIAKAAAAKKAKLDKRAQ